MCFILLLLNCPPFLSSLIVLWLSWYMKLLWIIYTVPLGSIRSILTELVNHLLRQSRPQLNSWCSDYVWWTAYIPLLLPWPLNHQYGSSYPYVLQTLHQRTTLYFLTFQSTKSVVEHCFLVFISSPSSSSCIHQYQSLSLYCIGRVMLAGCLDVPSFKYIVIVPQSGRRDLPQLGIFHWLVRSEERRVNGI